jgi:spore germination protein GerM
MIVLYLALAWVGYYYYRQATDLKKNPQRQQAILQQEADSLVAAVGRLIVLPTDEQPTIATVSDPEKLRNEAFFSAAKSGDKVLIYSKAKKAILYDPIADKIVEVAPLNINLNTQ